MFNTSVSLTNLTLAPTDHATAQQQWETASTPDPAGTTTWTTNIGIIGHSSLTSSASALAARAATYTHCAKFHAGNITALTANIASYQQEEIQGIEAFTPINIQLSN